MTIHNDASASRPSIRFELHGALEATDRQGAETILGDVLANTPLADVDHLMIDGDIVDAIDLYQRTEAERAKKPERLVVLERQPGESSDDIFDRAHDELLGNADVREVRWPDEDDGGWFAVERAGPERPLAMVQIRKVMPEDEATPGDEVTP